MTQIVEREISDKKLTDAELAQVWIESIYREQTAQTKHLKSINTAVSFMAIMLLLAIVLAACNALL